ncbi:GOLPH3/VPS74 family protein [Kribbella sp. CA-293567]|uniref:GOLPH3/VPS74 family protein n=1 Tax=Kribbella sp. CA-293567 TaxID=3002436 RepID=UPI0022DD46DF|nr:GPP34 family phosphoprotein [Kribbella sp. CA-293567]WBQ03476.1 GPP34 family phosphoprotein [Kribbella sp. CA-293567]
MTYQDEPTLAEDLLLLLFQPRSGTIAGENTLFYTLGGAVLADLALQESVTFSPSGGKLETVKDHVPIDPTLRSAWDYIAEKPRRVQTVLAAVGPALREPLLQRLVDRGDIEQRERKTLFVFTTKALSEGSNGRRAELLAAVREALVDGVDPTARVAALAALISGSGTLPQFHSEIPWNSAVIARAKELEQGNWGAGAAAEAVTRTMTAMIVNNAVAAVTVIPRTS